MATQQGGAVPGSSSVVTDVKVASIASEHHHSEGSGPFDQMRTATDAAGSKEQMRLLTDQPIGSAADDGLGLDAVASALESLIAGGYGTPPFTMAINAPWGGGKSSLARLLQARLDRERPGAHERPDLVCWFNAWDHIDAPDVAAALAAAVARTAQIGQSLWRRVLHPLPMGLCDPRARWRRVVVVAAVTVLTLAALAWTLGRWGGDPSKWGKAPDIIATVIAGVVVLKVVVDGLNPFWAALSGYVKDAEKAASTGALGEVKKVLARITKRATKRTWWGFEERWLVVVVDDVDRCPPGIALDICTAGSQLLSLPNVVVVLLADMQVIGAEAAVRYGLTGAEDTGGASVPRQGHPISGGSAHTDARHAVCNHRPQADRQRRFRASRPLDVPVGSIPR